MRPAQKLYLLNARCLRHIKTRDRQRPLPPTFEYCSPGVPGLSAKCIYTLTVEILNIRNLAFWKRRIRLAS
jgi:hypothetical protein